MAVRDLHRAEAKKPPEAFRTDRRSRHIIMTVNAAWNIWNFRRPLVEDLLAAGDRVTVLAPRDESVCNLRALGCHFVHLDMDVKGLNPLQDLALVRRYRRLFRSERPDAVLSYTIKNNIFGALATWRLGILFIPNVTGLGTAFLSGGLLQKAAETLYRLAFSPLPTVFFQNADDRDLFLKRHLVGEVQARLLPGSGIDLERFSATDFPPESDPPVFLMIARLLRDKGVLEFVEAARLVKARFPEARFQLLGAIGSENRTAIDRDTVNSWQQDGTIEYLGTTTDVRPHIETANCVVLPSYREGAPRTLIEAAAMARPLITTDVPGCRSIVDNGVSGLLCEVRDAQSLAKACQTFLSSSRNTQIKMGQAGRAKMEREFDQAIVVAAYRDALAERAPVVDSR